MENVQNLCQKKIYKKILNSCQMKFKFYLGFLLLVCYSSTHSQIVHWPTTINPTTMVSEVVGTIGEFRGSSRFHQGVDLLPYNGDYRIINPGSCLGGCEVTTIYDHSSNKDHIILTDHLANLTYKFVHVDVSHLINGHVLKKGDCIESGQEFTTLYNGGNIHLHFEITTIDNITKNPLHYLPNFVDNIAPKRIQNELGIKGFKFNRQNLKLGTTTISYSKYVSVFEKQYLLLYDKVDIQAHLVDTRIPSGTNQVAPYVLEYSIFKDVPDETPILVPEKNFNTFNNSQSYCFDNHPDDSRANFCFGPQSTMGSSSLGIPYATIAILTSNPFDLPYDRYWNTKLKKDFNQNWPAASNDDYNLQNARANEEAHYSDGLYVLDLCAEDYRPQHSNGSYCIPKEDTRVVIDNFMPYVKSIVLSKGNLKVTSEWIFNPADGTISFFAASPQDVLEDLFLSGLIQIDITFSEPIKESSLNATAEYREVGHNQEVHTLTNPENINNESTKYRYSVCVNVGQHPSLAELAFKIEAEDFAGNPILAMQTKSESNYIIPKRHDNVAFIPAVIPAHEGKDQIHVFSVEGCYVPGGIEGPIVERSGDCIDIDFTYHIAADGCSVIFEDISEGIVGNNRSWNFGDGSNIDGNISYQKHYSENGCYEVTLTRTWNEVYTITKTVCLNFCGEDFDDFLECEISGPTMVKAGQTITLFANSYGVSPFSYSWGSGSFNLTKIGENGNSATYSVNEFATNGESEIVYLEVYDSFGNSSTCIHTLTINGNLPDYDVFVFGEMIPNTYLYFLGFIDLFNTSGFVQYQFTIYDENNVELFTSPWAYDYDYSTCFGPLNFCLGEGHYKILGKAKDNNGEYEASRNFTIGNPVYVPPSPPMYFSCLYPNDCKLINGDQTIILKYDGVWPFNATFLCQDKKIYLKDIKLTNLNTGEEENIALQEPGLIWNQEQILFTVPCHWIGTIQIDATAYQQSNCDGVWTFPDGLDPVPPWYENEPYQMPSMFFDRHPSLPEIVNLAWDENSSSCNYVLEVEAIGGCKPYTFDWKFFDYETEEEIEDLATFLENKANLDLNHEYFYNNRHNNFFQINVEVEITDVNGKSSSVALSIQGANPLIVEESIERTLCMNSSVTLDDLYTGGSSNIQVTWTSGDLNYLTYDTELNKYVFNAPVGANNMDVFSYTCEIEDVDCDITKELEINFIITPISIIGDAEYKLCNDGSGDKRFNPIVSGGAGNYTYRWTNGEYLDASNHLNPRIVLPVNYSDPIDFELEVFDEYGCTASKVFPAIPGQLDYLSTWTNSNDSYCFNTENEITSYVHSEYPVDEIIYEWTNDNWIIPKTTKDITFGSEITKIPGLHQIKLKAKDPEWGCSKTEYIDFEVLDQITYKGYKTETRAYRGGGGGPNYSYTDLWTSPASQNIILSPNSSQNLDYAFDYGVPTILNYNVHDIPSSANYSPLWSEGNEINMRISNELGCFTEIGTNRYIILSQNVLMEIFSESPPFVCQGDELKLKIVVTAKVSKNAHLLPTELLLSWRQSVYVGGGFIEQGTAKLIHSGISGRYEGFLSLTPHINYGAWHYDKSYEFVASLDPSRQIAHPWNDNSIMNNATTAKGEFIFNGGVVLPINNSTLNVCESPPYSGGSTNQYFRSKDAVKLTFEPAGNCSGTYVPIGYEYRGIGKTKQGSVSISSLLVDEGGFFAAYINPCLELGSQKQENFTREFENVKQSELEMNIFPNPTSSNLNIEIHMESENYTEYFLDIIDLFGNKVSNIFENKVLNLGNSYLEINISNLVSGSYIIRLTDSNGNFVQNKIFFKL